MASIVFLIGSVLLLVIIMIGVIQASRKIRTKLVICFFLITLIPVIPLIILINEVIGKNMMIGVNKEIIDTLESTKVLVKEVLQREKDAVIEKAVHLSKNPSLIPKTQNAELLPATIENPIIKRALEEKKPFAVVCGERDEIVKGIAPVFENGKIKEIVIVSSRLEEDFVSSIQKLKDRLKFYRSIDLLRVPIGQGYVAIFILIALIMVIVAFLTGYIISKKLTTPLKNLITGLEEVGRGNLDYQVKAETKDEIAHTIASFNKMVKELKESRKLLIEAEREEAWRGIAQKIAHEIKAPLTPIQLSLQHLQDKYYENPKEYEKILKECTRRISEEVEALRKMAKEFSEFARMPKAHFEYTDVNKILADTVNFFAQINPEIKFNTTYGVNLPRIKLDRERMKRVFKNIIQNGIEALTNGGEINIKSDVTPEFIKIEFQDTGTGMDEETLKKLFTPYFSTKSHGMGLGLPIVDRIIHEHRGKIEVKSQLGKGSTFTIFLPIE